MIDLIACQRALISVYDKSGLIELVSFLARHDVMIFSTGKTARYLLERGFRVNDLTMISQFPEILDGRVKTLNSRIFASILADREKPEHQLALNELDLAMTDLVVTNLYPFQQIATDLENDEALLIENIDIGGVSLIRAAAKNYRGVMVLSNPNQYGDLIKHYEEHRGTRLIFRREAAIQAFSLTAEYDRAISQSFNERFWDKNKSNRSWSLQLAHQKDLRYGENPQQKAALYRHIDYPHLNLAQAQSLHGKELSYNNLLDAHAAITNLRNLCDQNTLATHAAIIIKHRVPSGAAIASSSAEAIKLAITSDEKSAFGGIMAINTDFDGDSARALGDLFLEIIIAKSFSEEALALLAKRKLLRLIALADLMSASRPTKEMRSIYGGLLVQDSNIEAKDYSTDYQCVTQLKPEALDLRAMNFAERIIMATPSNAIAIACANRLLGIGAGQPNRVQAVELAIKGAVSRGFDLSKAALASDGFFPFGDSLELAHAHGIKLILEPGGSIADQKIIDLADRLELCMCFSNRRHFYH